MSLHQIGELSGRLPKEFKEKHKETPWSGIKQIRNIISHDYIKIDLSIIWNTIRNDIPPFKEFLILTLKKIEEGEEEKFYKKD